MGPFFVCHSPNGIAPLIDQTETKKKLRFATSGFSTSLISDDWTNGSACGQIDVAPFRNCDLREIWYCFKCGMWLLFGDFGKVSAGQEVNGNWGEIRDLQGLVGPKGPFESFSIDFHGKLSWKTTGTTPSKQLTRSTLETTDSGAFLHRCITHTFCRSLGRSLANKHRKLLTSRYVYHPPRTKSLVDFDVIYALPTNCFTNKYCGFPIARMHSVSVSWLALFSISRIEYK